MSGHEVTAPVTGGTARANRVHKDDDAPEYHAAVSVGKWSCTCGKSGMTDEEAAEHLREVGQT